MADYNVSITLTPFGSLFFSPSSLTIQSGDRVRFIIEPGGLDNVSGTASSFDSGKWTNTSNLSLSNGYSAYKTSSGSGTDTINFFVSGFDGDFGGDVEGSGSFNISIGAPADDTPDSFNLGTGSTSASRGTNYYSSTITVSGMDAGVSTSVSITGGGAYSKNGGSYTTSGGTVQNGDTVRVRVTSSTSFSTTSTTLLNIGGVTDSYSVTTEAIDTIPAAFSLGPDVTGASLLTDYISSTVTISGINSNSPVEITTIEGEWSKNNGLYTSTSGFVQNGDTVKVKGRSSGSFGTTIPVGISIGGVTDSFNITTLAADTTPDSFNLGSNVSNANRSTYYYSNTITVSGINTSTSVSVTNAQYSKNGGSYTSSSGTVVSGDTLRIRIYASSSFSTAVTGTLNVGGVTDSVKVTTLAADTTPNSFNLGSNVSNANRSTYYYSNTITVSGINTSTSVSVTNAQYRKNGGSYTSSAGTVVSGDTLQIRVYASSSYSTGVTGTLNVGGVTDSITITTGVAPDSTPNAFSLGADDTGAYPGELRYSDTANITGINQSVTASITGGGSFKVNSSSYSTSNKTVTNNDTVRVRANASTTYGAYTTHTLTVGGVSDTWRTRTKTFSYSFASLTNVGKGVYYYDTCTLPTGGSVTVTASGGHFSTGGEGGSFVTSATVAGGTTITVRLLSSSSSGTTTSMTLTAGGVSETFSATTFSSTNTPGSAVTFQPSFTGSISCVNALETLNVTSVLDVSYLAVANGSDLGSTAFATVSETFIGIRAVKLYLERWKNGSLDSDTLFKDFDADRYGAGSYNYRDLSLQNTEQVTGGHMDGQASAALVGPYALSGTTFYQTQFPRYEGSGGWGAYEDQAGLDLDQNYKYRLRAEFEVIVRKNITEVDPEPGSPPFNSTTYYSSGSYTGSWEGVTISSGTPTDIPSNPILYSSFSNEVAYSPTNRDYIINDLYSVTESFTASYRPTVTFTAPAGNCDVDVYANGSLVDTLQIKSSGWDAGAGEHSSVGNILRSGQAYTIHLESFSAFTRGTEYTIYFKCKKVGDYSTFANSNDTKLKMLTIPTPTAFSASDGQYEVVKCTWTRTPGYRYQVRRASTTLNTPVLNMDTYQDAFVGSATYSARAALYDTFFNQYSYGSWASNAGSSIAAPTPPTQVETNCSLFLGRDGSTPKLIIGTDGLSESATKALSPDTAYFHSDNKVLLAEKFTMTGTAATNFTLPTTLRTALDTNVYIAVGTTGVVKQSLTSVPTINRTYSGNTNTYGGQSIERTLGTHKFGTLGDYNTGDTSITTTQPFDQVDVFVLNLDRSLDIVEPNSSATDILLDGNTFRVGKYDYGTLSPVASMGDQVDGGLLTNNGQQQLNYYDDVVPLGQNSSTVNNVAFEGEGAAIQVLNTAAATGWDITPNTGAIARNVNGNKSYWWNASSGRTRLTLDTSTISKTITTAQVGQYIDISEGTAGGGWNTSATALGYTSDIAWNDTISTSAIPGNHVTGAVYLINVFPTTGGTILGMSDTPTVVPTTLPEGVEVPIYVFNLNYSFTTTETAQAGGSIFTREPGHLSSTTKVSFYAKRVGNTIYFGRDVTGSAVGVNGVGNSGGALSAAPPPSEWGRGVGVYYSTFNGLQIKIRRFY